MITVVVDRNMTGNVNFYYNATLVLTKNTELSYDKSLENTIDFNVGYSWKFKDFYYYGCIDDLKIYHDLLSP